MDVDSSAKFIGSLTKFLQSLCNGYVEFQKGVELVGHIYLSIDTGEKVDYILHEKVSKNDENSVTFVSNSFHAQPLVEEDKNKTAAKKGAPSQSDDDDIVIVDQSKGELGSTNSGTVPSRGLNRSFSSGLEQRRSHHTVGSLHQNQGSSSSPISSSVRNRQQLGPPATVTSQDSQQDNINIGNVKLEQMSADELLSLASQVGDGTSPTGAPHSVAVSQRGGKEQMRRSSMGDAAGQPVWIKQEAPDDAHGGPDTGWTQGREGQSDSSNSGSNLYPVMMHQNTAAFSSSPVFPGFPSMSGSLSSSQHGSGQPLPGTPGSANPFGSPMMSGIDPAALYDDPLISQAVTTVSQRKNTSPLSSSAKKTLEMRRYRERLRRDPVRYRRYLDKQNEYARRRQEKMKSFTQSSFEAP